MAQLIPAKEHVLHTPSQVEKLARTLFLWKIDVHDQKERVYEMRRWNEALVTNMLPDHVARHFLGSKKRDEVRRWGGGLRLCQGYPRKGLWCMLDWLNLSEWQVPGLTFPRAGSTEHAAPLGWTPLDPPPRHQETREGRCPAAERAWGSPGMSLPLPSSFHLKWGLGWRERSAPRSSCVTQMQETRQPAPPCQAPGAWADGDITLG